MLHKLEFLHCKPCCLIAITTVMKQRDATFDRESTGTECRASNAYPEFHRFLALGDLGPKSRAGGRYQRARNLWNPGYRTRAPKVNCIIALHEVRDALLLTFNANLFDAELRN